MTYMLDTSSFSDLLMDRPGVRERLRALSPADRIVTCPIVRGEILHGIQRMAHGRKRSQLEQSAAQFFRVAPCVAIGEAVGDQYALVKHACQIKGTPLDENDLWIAAATIDLGAILVTRDADFSQVTGLSIESWAPLRAP